MIGKRIDSKKKAGVPTMKNRNQTAKVLYLLLTVLAVLTLFAAACAQEQPETDEEDPIEYPNPESPDENAEFPPETPAETGYFGVSAEDLAALDQIYNQMTEFGRSNSGWFGANPDVCSWMGLGCENGSIVRFSFDNVEFFCEIPSALTALPALREIHLTNTLLRGVVPDNFLQKDTLEQVDLSNNLLTGPIPENIYAPGLQNLTLSGNKLTGEKQQMLNERPNLAQCEANLTIDPYREIDLTPGIDGQIPPSIGGLSVMSRLDLSGNNLSGALPYEMTYLWSLGSLFLNDNNTEQPLMTDHPEVIAKLEMIPDKNIDGVVLASPPTVEIPTEVPTDTPEPTWTEIPTEIPTDTPEPTWTEIPTDTPEPTWTEIPTEIPTDTPEPTWTEIPTEVPTDTPEPPTAVPPTAVPPTAVPPTAVPPTAVPPTAVPPTPIVITVIPPTAVPPTPIVITVIPPTPVPPTTGPIIIEWVTATSQPFYWATATPQRNWMTATPYWRYQTATPMPYVPPIWVYPTAPSNPNYVYPTSQPNVNPNPQPQPTYYTPPRRTAAPPSNWTPFAQVPTATKAPTVNPASQFGFTYDSAAMTAERLPVSWKYTGMDSYMINYLTKNKTLFPGFAMEWTTADKLCTGTSCKFEILNIPMDLLKDGVFYIQLQGRDKSGRVYQSDPIGLQAAVTPEPSATPVPEEVEEGNWFTRFLKWLFGPIIRLFGGDA